MVEVIRLRDNLINVITNVCQDYELKQLMPLINLLKMINNKLVSNETQEGKINENSNDSTDIDTNGKIAYLVNRIHIESTMQVNIDRAMDVFMRNSGVTDYINKLRRERLSSMEMKKLFVVALKQLLFENKANEKGLTNMDIDGGLLECDLMSFIKTECDVCSGVLGIKRNNAIDQFCMCNYDPGKKQALKAVSAMLEISVHGFVGHYDSLDLDKIFKGLMLPCPDITSWKGNCECSGVPKSSSFTKSKRDRRVLIVIDKQMVASSKWCNTKVKGLEREKIAINHAKEIELQIWESRKENGKKEKGQFLVGVVSIPLESLIMYNEVERLTLNCEPAGVITCEIRMSLSKVSREIPEATRLLNHKIKRTFSIKRKLVGYKHARDLERKVCVSTWEKWFRINMKKFTVTSENNNVIANKSNKSSSMKEIKPVSIIPLRKGTSIHDAVKRLIIKAFHNQSDKYNITNPKSTLNEIKNMSHDRYINMTPSIYSNKLNNINPRTVRPFMRSDNEPSFNCQNNTNAPKYLVSILMEPLQTSKLDDTESVNINVNTVFPSPIASRITRENVTTSTPIAVTNGHRKLPANSIQNTSFSLNQQSYLFMKGLKTRSNLELSEIGEAENMPVNVVHSDDEDAKNELRYDGTCTEELNIIKFSKLMLHNDTQENIPLPCSPELRKMPIFKIGSDSKSNNHSCRSYTPLPMKKMHTNSFHIDESMHTEESYDCDMNNDRALATPLEISDVPERIIETALDNEFYHSEDEQYDDHYDSKVLQFKDLDLISVLGQGHFGKVLLAKYNKEPRINGLCAIKVIYKHRAVNDAEYDSLIAERNILMRITASNNPFLVGLIGCFQTDRHLIFGIEYACGGDLMGHIHKSPFSELSASFYGACIVLALGFLHDNDIMYRDIKLDNLLMDAQGYVKLTDFGLSKEHMHWNATTTTFCGTPEFLAPEIVLEQPYTRVVDWWAFGVLLFEMMLGETPFPGDEDNEIFRNILDKSISNEDLSTDALSIIRRLLQHVPSKRLGYGQNGTEKVMKHGFFRHIDWEALAARTVEAPLVPQLDDPIDTQYFESDFTKMSVHVEHGEEIDTSFVDDDDIFKDFDTCINWDKFVNL